MKKYAILITTLLIGSIILIACTPTDTNEPAAQDENSAAQENTGAGETKTLYVGPETAECTGVAPQTCLLVKENPEDEYTFFYDSIEGFAYEPGYEYELLVNVTPVENPPADGSSLKYTLVEEVSKTSVTSAEAMPLEGTLWQMVSATHNDGSSVIVNPEVASTITFNADGTANGNNGCNNVGMGYTVDGNNISMQQGPSTMMACPPEVEAQAAGYDDAIANAATFTIEGSTLTLFNAEGNSLATFEAVEPLALTDATWQVTGYNNGTGGVVSVDPAAELTITFNEDGTLGGNAGCNSYFGSYSVDGSSISINEQIGATMMACEQAVMDQEQLFLAALPTAETMTIQGDKLELRTADGALVISAVAMPSSDLAGTAWDVISYNNGKEAVVSVILDTQLTAVFGEDGSLSGSAGCNDYTTSYEIDGDTISIMPAATTRKMCAAPEGIMEQEAEYLTALTTAATYSVQGDRMEMRTADGALVGSFQAQ